MNMVELVIGAIVGAGAMYYVKSRLAANEQEQAKSEIDRLNHELDIQRSKRHDLEQENLSIQQEIHTLKQKNLRQSDKAMDMEDSLEDEKRKSDRLKKEVELLQQSLSEYKIALQACQLEVADLKNK